MLALRLTPDMENRLDHIAKITGRSKHFYATEAIETHLLDLENKYLSAQERAEVQASIDFNKIEMALAGTFDADLLNPVEAEYLLDETIDAMASPSEESKRLYQALGQRTGACGTDDNGNLVWRHADGTDKPYPPEPKSKAA